MSLKTKFTIFISFLLTIIIVGIAISMFFSYKKLFRDQLEQSRTKIFKDFIYTCSEAVAVKDELLIYNTIRSLIETHRPAIVYAGYVPPSGIILSSFRDNLRPDAFQERMIMTNKQTIETFSSERNEGIYELGYPLRVKDEYAGTIKLGFSQDHLNSQIEKGVILIANKILLVSILALVLGIIFALILSAHLIEQIKHLSQAAVKLGEGDLNVQVEIDRKDELGKLGRTFNEMAQKVKELDELKDGFVSSVSHELRSPLAAIDGYCEYMIEGLSKKMSEEKQKKALEIIRESTIRLTNFVNNILDLAKIRADKFDIKKMPADVKDISEEIVLLFTPLVKKEDKHLKADIPDDLPRLNADPERIKQVITNLISNALKFTPPGADIIVGAKRVSEQFVEIYIADTGVGIPADEIHKVFDKFYQVKGGESGKKPKGTGLGLAICNEIVKLHGGAMTLDSAVGEGTTFRFTIPIWRSENY